jgi:hypothetical protein
MLIAKAAQLTSHAIPEAGSLEDLLCEEASKRHGLIGE